MSTSTLAHIWSLNTGAHGHANGDHTITPIYTPSSIEILVVNTLLRNRCGAHFLSTLLTAVPASEARLRNEGLIPFYNLLISFDKTLKSIAHQKQITLPPYPDISAEWRDEAAINIETLRAALLPPAVAPLVDLMGFMVRLMSTEEYHWGSLVTFISVASDAYHEPVGAHPKGKPEVDVSLVPFSEAMRDGGMVESSKVIREELLRCRNEAAETGWKEEEAKELTIEHLKLLKGYWATVQG